MLKGTRTVGTQEIEKQSWIPAGFVCVSRIWIKLGATGRNRVLANYLIDE